jgi:hypothetical protein
MRSNAILGGRGRYEPLMALEAPERNSTGLEGGLGNQREFD